MIFGMIEFARLADLCRRLRTSPGRLDKPAMLADYRRALPPDAVGPAVAFLTGRPFPQSDPRVLGVRWLPSLTDGPAAATSLTLGDLSAAFGEIAEAGGAGSRRTRDDLLRALAARASADERETLQRIITGEMRTGVSDGLVLEAIARAFAAPLESTRRAALRLGDLSAVAVLAARGGAAALTSASVRPFVPLLPMLAQIAEDFEDVLMADGRSLIDEPYASRWEALTRVTGGRHLAERLLATTPEAAREFQAKALAAGHEGLVAKDLRSTYEPGGRGKRWFKLKTAETVDCVIIAVDRGSGRRSQWLSNYHLAVRDGEAFADVGKTFKGFTDRQFIELTERLWTLAVR